MAKTSKKKGKKKGKRKAKSRQSGAGAARDYRQEYDTYYGKKGEPSTWTPLQRRHRQEKAARNRARRKYLSSVLDKVLGRERRKPTAAGKKRMMSKVKKGIKGVDIDHIDGNPLNNSAGNLRPLSMNLNRKMNGH